MSAYYGGVPYDPDVRKLQERFGVPEVGEIIRYEALAKVVDAEPGTGRFRGVVDAWLRRLLREHNVEAKTLRGVGFEFMTPNERVDEGARRSRLNARQLGRITRKVGMVPSSELDPLHLQIQDHILLANQRVLLEANARDRKRAQLTGVEAYKQNPKRTIPQSKR